MDSRIFTGLLCTVGFGAGLLIYAAVRSLATPAPASAAPASMVARTDGAAGKVPANQGRTQGPRHEASVVPEARGTQPEPVVTEQPPEPLDEQPPEPDNDQEQWIPGYWARDEAAGSWSWVGGNYCL